MHANHRHIHKWPNQVSDKISQIAFTGKKNVFMKSANRVLTKHHWEVGK